MKNPNGFGTCYKLPGNRRRPYIARAYTGKYGDYKTIGYFRTKREARTALMEYNLNPYDIDMKNITLEEVCNKVIEEKRKDVSETTLKDNYIKVYQRFFSELGDMKFTDLRPAHYQKLLAKYEDGHKASYLKKAKSFLSIVYKWAILNDVVSTDYSKGVIIRGKSSGSQDFFTEAELKYLIENMHVGNTDVIVIMCLTGLRPSEMLNLTVENIDIENRIIRNVGTKTDKGKAKRIPISSIILPFLEKRRSESDSELFLYHGKPMTYLQFLNHIYKPCFEVLQVEYKSPKACRHTFANLTHKRLSDKARTSIIGHTDIKLTNEVYTDLEDHVLWEEFLNVEQFLTNF